MTGARILVTGSREWANIERLALALHNAIAHYASDGLPVLVHGGAAGADAMADDWWRMWETLHPGTLARPEVYHARDFPSPLARNQHMVNLGADVCVAFALQWKSGTGHCARRARIAGIPTFDYGVDTSMKGKPPR